MKPNPNQPCPCKSKKKYKKCCQPYHKGAKPKDALTLMKSRYSAYAVGDANYILKTTHPDSPYSNQTKKEIEEFCKTTKFLGLEILDFVDGEEKAYVIFKATFEDSFMIEKSLFYLKDGRWLYHSGEFL